LSWTSSSPKLDALGAAVQKIAVVGDFLKTATVASGLHSPSLPVPLILPEDSTGDPMNYGDLDLRGWEVRTLSGKRLGQVRDLVTDGEGPPMLDMAVAADRNVRVPVRSTRIDHEHRVVLMDSETVGQSAPAERRQGERRRAERVSTDL
jgi:hypothetical protein